MRVVVEIELYGRFILKFFLLFVSVLIDIDELSGDLNLGTLFAVERNVNVLSVFKSVFLVFSTDDNRMRCQ